MSTKKCYYRVIRDTGEVLQDNIPSYEEAWELMYQLTPNFCAELKIEEYVEPVTGFGRDPDLHTL